MRWESLVEITQMKGTSEIRPSLAPTDEFANYEIRRKLLIGTPTPPDEGDYVRTALMRGMEIEAEVGENPYRFGFVGATDGHIGMASVEENNFYGKIASDAKLSQHLPRQRPVIFPAWEMSASGLTGVWAEENTRDSIFSSLKRKEVYATTGPRIALRVFGGFSFDEDDASSADQTAFYYVRVIEIPTPRHSLYDAVALGIDPEVTNYPATIQERAYSSPIWYTP